MLERSKKMRTNDRVVKELYEKKRTPIVEACTKVQLSVRKKSDGNVPVYETEVIDSRCSRIDGDLCGACTYPDKKWRLGICNLATHLYIENKAGESPKFLTPITLEFVGVKGKTKFVNPIKKSKRG